MALRVVRGSLRDAASAALYAAPAVSSGVESDRYHADLAANAHHRALPQFSAATPFARWQKVFLYLCAAAAPAGLILSVQPGLGSAALILAVPFALIVLIRIAALTFLYCPQRTAIWPMPSDAALPAYTLLVPVYREREIAPALIEALRAIDYPAEKLEIFLITEEDDTPTREALRTARPPDHMRILTVPRGSPQTKPRALNFALRFARGDIIAIYDAEDVPDPAQLRRAAAKFAACGDDLACVQARLSIYNPEQTWFTRHFALEYAVLFEAILPALERLRLPILLGGTSNHFRRAALLKVGAWDAYNVTEDADLGIRLSRFGYRVAMLDSDTWEEAPATAKVWLRQRTRWLKGWMQTVLVHTRAPRQLYRDLGLWQTFGLQVVLGGMVLSALVHPWIYLLTAIEVMRGHPVFAATSGYWMICWFNFTVGHVVGIALGLVAAWRSQGRLPLFSALLVPVYWLAISVAAYRALWEFYRRPYYWEKTPHAARPVTEPLRTP